jgi:hypothetical protein
VSFDFKESFIEFMYSNLMSATIKDRSEFDKVNAHALSGVNFLAKDEIIKTYLVPAMNLESILDQANAPSLIDFFSLDVEGHELDVLKGLNHTKYRFKYIGTQPIDNIQSVNNTIQFYQIIVDDNGQQRAAQNLNSVGQIINQTNKLTKTTYNTGDVTQEFSANLVRDNYLLGENTDIIYLPVQYYFNQLISPNSISTKTVRDNFLMEILPDSTFSLLPR